MTVQTIVFQVPDEVAAQMRQRTVYLDVYGIVRWSENFAAVEGATPWASAPAISTMREAVRSSPDSPREPQPGDGPDYHAEHAAWRNRRSPDSGRSTDA